jgi:hypothetical protein
MNEVFQSVVRQDKTKRWEQVDSGPVYESFSATPVTVITIEDEEHVFSIEKDSSYDKFSTYEDMRYVADQLFLLHENPINVFTLDSMFRSTQKKNMFPVQTAVIYTDNSGIHHSRPDTAFYTSAIALDEIRIGGGMIRLQAFVRVSPVYWLNEAGSAYTSILLAWLLGMGILAGYGYYLKRDKFSIVPLNSTPSVLKKLTEDLLFDEKCGRLLYLGQTIELRKIQLKIFISLLDAPDHYLSYTEMKEKIWNNEDTPQNSVHKSIERLKIKLAPVSVLALMVHHGKGCRLEIIH